MARTGATAGCTGPVQRHTTSPKGLGARRKRKETGEWNSTPSPRPTKRAKQERQDCSICAETKLLTSHSFPSVSTCEHNPTVCRECYKTHFNTRIKADLKSGWAMCTCPCCGESVTETAARSLLGQKTSAALTRQIKEVQRTSQDAFLWCPAEGCRHGQVHNPRKGAKVACSKCKTTICFNHRRTWHSGLTCNEFDGMADHDEAARKDQEALRKMTKPCPHCGMRIKKEGGCNHMVCGLCYKHWMWNEIAFEGEHIGTGAEVAGGREMARPLGPAHRRDIDRFMQFANQEIDNRRTTVQSRFQRLVNWIMPPPRHTPVTRPANARVEVVGNRLEQAGRVGATTGQSREPNTRAFAWEGGRGGIAALAANVRARIWPTTADRSIQQQQQRAHAPSQ